MRRIALSVLITLTALPAAAASLAERLPDGVTAAGWVDVARLRSSRLFDTSSWLGQSLRPDVDAFRGALAAAGIDPQRDLDEIAFGMLPTGGEAGPSGGQAAEPDVALVARGRFDQAALEQAAVARGAVRLDVAGVGSALRLPAGPTPEQAIFLTFLESGVLAAGSKSGLAGLRGKDRSSAPALAAARRHVSSDAMFWLVGLGGTPGADAAKAAVPGLGDLKALAIWGETAKDSLELRGLAEMKDAQAATQVAAFLQLGASMLRAQQAAAGEATQPGLELLSDLKLAADADKVTARLSLTRAQLRSLQGQN